MKKRWIKRAVTLGLALTLTVGGMTACGGSGVDKQKNALAKENVYSFQEYSLPDLGGDYSNMMGSFHADGRIYVLMQVEHYSEDYYTSYHIVSFKEDGTDAQQVTLELNEVVLTEEEKGGFGQGDGEGTIDGAEDAIIDGVMPLSTAREPEAPEDVPETDEDMDADVDVDVDTDTSADTDIDSDLDLDDDFGIDDDMFVDGDVWDGEKWDNTYESNYLRNLSCGNGAIYGIRNYYYSNYTYGYDLNKTFICSWNLDGTVRWETELADSQNMWIQTMTTASDGTLTILLSKEDAQYMLSISADGQMGEQKKVSDKARDAFSSNALIQARQNGSFFIVYSDANDWTKYYAAEYDPVTDTMSDPVDIPSSILYAQSGMMKVGENSDLIYHTNSGLYTYNIGDEEGKKKMDYINSDLYITSLQDVVELDETHFVGMFFESYDWGNLKAGLFTYTPPEEIPDKKAIVLAGMWLGDIRQRVIEFNRNSQEYRITIKDYSEYNSYGDYEAGQTQMNNDIVTGNMPDILVVNSNMPIENYIAKGWLADINDFIKKDEELSQEEFVQNVFDAYSVKGKLYYVIPSFYVSTMIAKTSIVGDRTSWTMSDMIELQKSLPEGTKMMEDMTRSNFLNSILMYCGNDFIDVETGKCTFDSEAFIDLIEYAKTFPEELVYDDSYWETWWENSQSQYREDRTILMSAYISSVTNFRYNLNGTFGEEVSYIGFPTSSGGMGAFVSYNDAYCISAKSRNKDGAWEFLRYYLTDEYQESDNRYSFSIQKDIFEEEAQKAMERPYWIDENGNKQEYDDTYYMNGEVIVIEPLTQEQVDKLVNYIYTIDNAYYYNTDIVNIIQEEIDAFFTGQKEAAEVANIIQRRAQVYVDENR